MGQTDQIFWGSVVLGICTNQHVGLLAAMIPTLERASSMLRRRGRVVRTAVITGMAFAMIVFSHTLQVWFWAHSLMWMGAFAEFYDALYFSLVTYTTVGYGDLTLPVSFRIFGAFGGVAGILCFGLSTALLVSLVSRLLPQSIGGSFDSPPPEYKKDI